MSPHDRVSARRALLLGLAALAAGCGSGDTGDPRASASGAAPSASGPTPRAERIVSVGGPLTEILFALGAGARVVGVDTSSQHPLDVEKLPKVGYQRQLAVEPLLALGVGVVTAALGAPVFLAMLARDRRLTEGG